MEHNIKELLKTIVTVLVDYPQDIDIKELHSQKCLIFELKVNSDDLGKIIGKDGRTARAVRILLESACAKMRKRCILEILG